MPGVTLAGFGFHLVGGSGEITEDWGNLVIEQQSLPGGSARFELSAAGTVPEDIYIHCTYPCEHWSYAGATLATDMDSEFLILGIPDRNTGVMSLGLARLGTRRGTLLQPGSLAAIEFTPGAEQLTRRASRVTCDPRSAPALYIYDGGCLGYEITWVEINPGDCNNNGMVEISDLTPVGIHYNKTAEDFSVTGEFEVIDCNCDGLISVGDLTPIGQNYGCGIDGYRIFATPDSVVNAEDSGAEVVMDIDRPETNGGRRIGYWELIGWPDKQLNYYVRAYQGTDDNLTLGVASNLAPEEDPDVEVRPYWEEGNGILSHEATSTTIDITFSPAIDPNGEYLSYHLLYAYGPGFKGAFDGPIELTVPPYEYSFAVDPPATDMVLEVYAKNESGYITRNNASIWVDVPDGTD